MGCCREIPHRLELLQQPCLGLWYNLKCRRCSRAKKNQRKLSFSRILRLFIWGSGIGLCLCVLSYGVWYWIEYRALRFQIDALHAAGELVEPPDFVHPIDPKNNGAKDVSAAATILDDSAEESRAIDFLPATRPTPPEAWPYLEAAVRWYDPALRRMDHAITKSNCEWDHSMRSPVMENLTLHELYECDSVCLLLITAALVEHHHQEDGIALRHLGELLYLSAAAEHSPDGVGHLRAVGITKAFVGRLEQFLPTFRIDATEVDAIRPAEIRSLIKTLSDESGTSAGLRFGLQANRMAVCDLYSSAMASNL
jgi:hypothetical protein